MLACSVSSSCGSKGVCVSVAAGVCVCLCVCVCVWLSD